MKLSEAITKAVEGGWSVEECMVVGRIGFNVDRAMLDPLFWQALGKSMGWRTEKKSGNNWFSNSRAFWDNIMDGKSIESYFESL